MSWLSSIGVALLSATAGTALAGSIAILAVDWYGITGREGASGYFVVSIGLLGLILGLIIGLVVSRAVAAHPSPGFWKALGISLALIVGLGAAVGGIARSQADVPPTVGGESLMLAVEVRWPVGHQRSPAEEPGDGILTLGSVNRFSHVQRASVQGPLWKEDARLVDGRWIAPGAVEIFTARGLRSLDIAIDTTPLAGFMVPLPPHPGPRDLEWSEWLPGSPPGAPPWPDSKFSYRYRAQPVSVPVRTETFGPFEIATIASQFYPATVEGRTTLAVAAEFAIRHRGKPIGFDANAEGPEHADAVTTIAGGEPALLVHRFDPGGPGPSYLVVGGGDQARVDTLANYQVSPVPLTSDTARFRRARHREAARGMVDRHGFEEPGLFLLGAAIVDTRRMTVRHYSATSEVTGVPAVPPLALSPDERSFVTFGYREGSEERPVLAVTDVVSDTIYTVPIDPARMRYATFDVLDPSWVTHHFDWQRTGGVDRLVERKGFVPLPYHGQLSGEGDGRTYRLEPAGQPLRAALVEFLVRQLGAERLPAEADAYEQPVRIDGRIVNVAASSNFDYVAVSMARGSDNTSLVDAIAKRFDAELATGKHDALFGTPPRGG